MPNAANEVFALVLKNPDDKLSNKHLNDLKTSIFTNYPGVKLNLIKVKSLKAFKNSLQKIYKDTYVDNIVAAESISDNDLVATTTSDVKFKSVSLQLSCIYLVYRV